MAFENISKGEFKANIGLITTETDMIAFIYEFKDKKENAEFIAYCFNLQQRYDISKLEEAVELFEKLKDAFIDNMPIVRIGRNLALQSPDIITQEAYNNIAVRIGEENKEDNELIKHIIQLLKEIKK